MVRDLQFTSKDLGNNEMRVVPHRWFIFCLPGCGRTGTICAIDFIWGLLRTGKLSSDFSLYELVKDMRRQRIAMVQTVDQYVLVHRAVKELFLEQLRVIDAHPYENVDDDGRPLCGQAKTDEHVVPGMGL